MLRERNTIRQVADHWACSPKTVYRRIADGSLSCMRLGGVLRISREQVEAYEQGCISSGDTKTTSGTFRPARVSKGAYQRGREIAGRLRRSLHVA